jgi:hypothetical protein
MRRIDALQLDGTAALSKPASLRRTGGDAKTKRSTHPSRWAAFQLMGAHGSGS